MRMDGTNQTDEIKSRMDAMDAKGGGNIELRYLSQKATAKLELFFMDKNWTVADVRRAIRSYGFELTWVEKKYLELNEFLSQDRDWTPKEPTYRLMMIDELNKQWFKRLQHMGELSILASADPYNQAVKIADSYKEKSNYFFLKTFDPFGYATITGIPGSGKTHMAVNLMYMSVEGDRVLKKPFRVATNIELLPKEGENVPDGIEYCNRLSEAILICIKNTTEHGALTNIILDELPQVFNRKRATSGTYVNMEKMLLLLRKVGGNFISVIQRPEDVPSVITSFSHCSMHKISKDMMVFKRDDETTTIKDVPPTPIGFNTRDIASFIIDVNMEAIHQLLTSLPKGTNQLEAIHDFLAGKSQGGISEAMVNTTIKVLHELRGFDWALIGEIMGLAPSTCYDRWSGKTKKGNPKV